ncbi:TPA: formyltransferase family protein, partial [Yersinia enterocolitica]
MNIENKSFIIAGYGLPAEIGMTVLFGLGVSPDNILLLTHPVDERNSGLVSLALLRGVKLFDGCIKNPAVYKEITEFAPDYMFSLHYRNLIPGNILKLVEGGCVNLHPSLLPDYRGTNSVPWAIINDENKTGYTFHYMSEEFDTGDILLQEVIDITENETAFSLFNRQIHKSMANFESIILKTISGEKGIPQRAGGSYYKRALPYNGYIDMTWPERKIDCFIRAMIFPPFPPAKLLINNSEYNVFSYSDYLRIIR